jgi:cytochrome c oxidase cbb3-type subunit 3
VLYLMVYPGLGSNAMFLGWTQIKEYEEEMARAEERYGPIFEQYLDLPIDQVAADPKALRIGERLFASYCTVCHGSDAGGVRGFPNLRDDSWQWGGGPGQIKTSILAGRTAVMPGWRDALGGDAGVDETVAYVLSLSGQTSDAAKAAAGKEKYDSLCVACHGADGAGNPALGAPSLIDDVWLYGGSEADVRHSVADGREGRMPAHGEFLGEARVHVLAAWVWSLSNR